MASATIWVWTVRDPWPMSTVPAKTSTRPSGLSLTHAWLGSPFWFMPVGYSIVAKPLPRCLAICGASVRASIDIGDLFLEVLGEQLAATRRVRHRAQLGLELDADPLGCGLDDRDGGRILEHDAVRRRVGDPVRVLEP